MRTTAIVMDCGDYCGDRGRWRSGLREYIFVRLTGWMDGLMGKVFGGVNGARMPLKVMQISCAQVEVLVKLDGERFSLSFRVK